MLPIIFLFLLLLIPFVAPGGRKFVEYFALGLNLKASLGMKHIKRIQIT